MALWGLSRPVSVRLSDDTQYLFPWITASDDSRWIMVDTGYAIPVHEEAVLDGIADILQPFIDGGQLPAETNEQLAAFIESKRGQSLVVYEAFPQFFKDQAKTYQQMIYCGLMSAPTP